MTNKKSPMTKFTLKQFGEMFPNDDACLEYLRSEWYPEIITCEGCKREAKFYRITTRKVYGCEHCGFQFSPAAGTIFHKSPTPLTIWFYVIYLMAQTRGGISAKQIQRETGVTYKTAWRMCKQIRLLMQQDSESLGGDIEADETYIGGTRKLKHRYDNKSVVFGMVERNGRIKASFVKTAGARVLLPAIQQGTEPDSHIFTDEWSSYKRLPKLGFSHTTVNHKQLEYVRGNAHTNTIEGFWSQLKRSMDGTYHSVSPKYLQSYLNEFSFRYNFRSVPIFPVLLEQAVKLS